MSLTLQVVDAQNDLGIQEVSSNCSDSPKFLYQLNAVTRQLLKRGAWYGTEVLMQFCVQGCDIVFPRHVGTVVGARTCCGQSNITNNWYSIVGPGSCCGVFDGNAQLVDNGQSPIYNQVSGTEGKQIAYHVVKQADVGKTIKIYGFQYGGQPLQEKVDGVWEDGVTVTAAMAGGATLPQMTTQLVTKITHIVRQPTSGMTYLYEYGPDANGTNALRDLAVYEPTETNPMYRRMRLVNPLSVPSWTDDYGRVMRKLDIMAKLAFIPLVNDFDFLLIDNLDALRMGIQALRADEAGDFEKGEIYWNKACRDLNFEDRQSTPTNQVAVKVRTGSGFVCSFR